MTTYAEALKKWNEGKSKWCMPKKGSDEHAQVLAIKEGKPVPKIDEEECKCPPPKAKAEEPTPRQKAEPQKAKVEEPSKPL
jgi:hypothetical protein